MTQNANDLKIIIALIFFIVSVNLDGHTVAKQVHSDSAKILTEDTTELDTTISGLLKKLDDKKKDIQSKRNQLKNTLDKIAVKEERLKHIYDGITEFSFFQLSIFILGIAAIFLGILMIFKKRKSDQK